MKAAQSASYLTVRVDAVGQKAIKLPTLACRDSVGSRQEGLKHSAFAGAASYGKDGKHVPGARNSRAGSMATHVPEAMDCNGKVLRDLLLHFLAMLLSLIVLTYCHAFFGDISRGHLASKCEGVATSLHSHNSFNSLAF